MPLLSRPRMPPRADNPARQLVVLVHGVGANGDDLIGLAPALAAALPGAAFVIGGDLLPVQALRRPPVFLIHGDADEVVPAAAMYAPVAGLQAAEIPVQWSLRRGLPHGIDPDSIAHGAAFLAAAFAETGA